MLVSAFRALIDIEPTLPCQRRHGVGRIQVHVADGKKGGRPVTVARVLISAADGSTVEDHTDQTGRTLEHNAPPGEYRVQAQCRWHLPDPSPWTVVQVTEGNLALAVIDLQELRFYLHVDADRDGEVDDDRRNNTPWAWGEGGTGAIVFCNNDDDDASGTADNEDNHVNGAGDLSDVAPLEVRRVGSDRDPPDSWQMTLSVSRADCLRIFATRTAAAVEVIGPTTGASLRPALAGYRTVTYGMEAVHHAGRVNGRDFDGLIDVTLEVRRFLDPGRNPRNDDWIYRSQAQVRVAPWLMAHHCEEAAIVFVSDLGDQNRAYRQSLRGFVQQAGCALVEVLADDKWMQDCMEIGYTTLPDQPSPRRLPVFLNTARPGALQNYAPGHRAPAVGVFSKGPVGGDVTYNYGGNIEVTPPLRDAEGKVHPWGRIYYGTSDQHPMSGPIDPELAAFLDRQLIQKAFVLDPSWLVTGHVDEMLTFVPDPNAADPYRRWKLLVVSPGRAYEILDLYNLNMNVEIFRQFDPVAQPVPTFLAGNTRFMDPQTANYYTGAWLRQYNQTIQTRMDGVLQALAGEIDFDLVADVVRVPVVFGPYAAEPRLAGALTGNMVNMLVLNGHCIIPKAFGPGPGDRRAVDFFERDLELQLTALGLTCHFLDASDYHVTHGEVHCSTNTLRRPADAGAWAASAAARWWEYIP
jgi:hypothetical protein